jgi:GNAT superfamily N-acetyltransferase
LQLPPAAATSDDQEERVTANTQTLDQRPPHKPHPHPESGLSFDTEELRCLQFTLHKDGRRVGYAQLHASSQTTVEIVDLFVEESFRSNGYGRAILEGALEFARSAGFADICAHASPDNPTAFRLFQSLGFHACENEVHMERDL